MKVTALNADLVKVTVWQEIEGDFGHDATPVLGLAALSGPEGGMDYIVMGEYNAPVLLSEDAECENATSVVLTAERWATQKDAILNDMRHDLQARTKSRERLRVEPNKVINEALHNILRGMR